MRRSEARPSPPAAATESQLSVASPDRRVPVSLGGSGAERTPLPSAGVAQIGPGAVRIPHDPVNEQILLAAACLAPDRRRELLKSCPAERFYGKGHAAFWSTLAELDARGLDFALDTVVQLSGGAIDAAYFSTILAARSDVPPNLRHHVEVLAWDSARVDAAGGSLADLIEQFRDQTTEPVVLAATARRLAEELSAGAPQGGSLDPAALVAENRAAYEARSIVEPVWPYGLDGFEREPENKGGGWRVKPGMKPGKTTVVTGLSGSGKSIVVKAIALGQSLLPIPRRGLFGAFEDRAQEVLEDLAGMSLGLDRNEVDEGRLLPEDKLRFFAEQERVASVVRFMRRPPRDGKKGKTTIAGRIDWCFSEATRVGADWLCLDLLARLFDTAKPDEEQKGWEHFQRCADESGIHGLATHQQRLKDIESRADHRPTREGMKGSAGVVEVVDTAIGVHRPALHETVEDKVLELILLKQRRGRWPFAVRFDFDPVRVSIAKGREVAYMRPGEDGIDDFVERPGRSRGRS